MTFHHEPRAQVIADSVSSSGVRVTTMEVTFHRFILAEVNTHRVLSRNSASSRAIPLEKMLARAVGTPALPLQWPREQPGMSGGDELEGTALEDAMHLLAKIRNYTTRVLSEYIVDHPDKSTRLHKSILNRPLEWFMWHTAILTSTEWGNLLKQRDHPDAQPEFRALAQLIRKALEESTPVRTGPYGFHIPYYDPERDVELSLEDRLKVSVARCARVSYLTHDGERDTAEDIRMHDETLWAKGHWSPMEHQALLVPPISRIPHFGNLQPPWRQLRHFHEVPHMRGLFRSAIVSGSFRHNIEQGL